jgi:uncharacterized protein YcbX
MTGEVKRLYERPLTGARAKEVKKVAISAGGIIGNRLIVVYNSFDSNNLKRVSQKEIRELAQLHARINAAGRVSITHKREDLDLDGFHLNPKEEPDLYVIWVILRQIQSEDTQKNLATAEKHIYA